MEESWRHLLDRRTWGIEVVVEGCLLGVFGLWLIFALAEAGAALARLRLRAIPRI